MDIDFAHQLALARQAAEIEEASNSSFSDLTDSIAKSNEQEEWMNLASEAGVTIKFEDLSYLRVQCVQVRTQHELAMLKDEAKAYNKKREVKPRVPLKCAVKQVQFGFGCC